MKVLLYGGHGFLGSFMTTLLRKKGHTVELGTARVDNEVAVEKELRETSPTHVFSCTGRTHGEGINTIDYLEQKGKLVENIRDNLYGPLVLTTLCLQQNIHCTIVGTGCIFTSPYQDGRPAECYTEKDCPNFFGSSYSVVKGFTDRLMHLPGLNHVLNLRIRMPIMDAKHPRCFVHKIARYEKVCSIANSMSYIPELFEYAVDMMEKRVRGTVNLVNKGTITHNEILELYEKHVDPEHKTVNFTEEEQRRILAAGRSNNELNCEVLSSMYPVRSIRDAVCTCLHVTL